MCKTIKLKWCVKPNNFGDILGPYLLNKIYGFTCKLVSMVSSCQEEHYLTACSSLQCSNKNTIVWGSGFISEQSMFKEYPKRICSVRGPLTRKKVLDKGFECPEAYGDIGLLISDYYKPVIEKKYKIGIIPHYVDKVNPYLLVLKSNKDILILDILKGVEAFINDLLSCEVIFSSALHGIIAADSYNIPAYWLKFSDKVIGNGFKFRDYFLSVGRTKLDPIIVDSEEILLTLENRIEKLNLSFSKEKILSYSPFR